MLDAMVLGTDDDRDAWGDLLASPRAGDLWNEAVERRRGMDAFATVLATHRWLATPALVLRRAMRRARGPAWPGATLDLSSPLTASLGPSATPSVTLHQGETRVLAVTPGDAVRVELPADTHLRRLTEQGEEPFDAPGWEMEPGDGVVVLIAVRGDGTPVATLVLAEKAIGENAD
jgi:hypothetical protein